jgi:hypothetical protein
MKGKTAFEHALYKACVGIVDPRDIEIEFESFETYTIREIKVASRRMEVAGQTALYPLENIPVLVI